MNTIAVVLCLLPILVQNVFGQYSGYNSGRNSVGASRCPLGYTYADIPPGSLPAIPPNPASACPLGYTWADVPAALAETAASPVGACPLGYNAANLPAARASRLPGSLGYNAAGLNSRGPSKCPLGYTYADIVPGSIPAIPPNPQSDCPLGYTWADVPAALASYGRNPASAAISSYSGVSALPSVATSRLGVASPLGAPLLNAAAPLGAARYGGAGAGNVAVSGQLPVAGNTAVTGQVPIMGAVRFGGDVASAGAVSIAGKCACA